ncbi:MAG: TetR family transcriptional regulator [Saprospirales bacterium]|nr:TetR family transcriptional regulator [Saprospirales bacterium]
MSDTPKKKEIFEEAAKLFQERGYSAASMRDLADRVNLKASSLYSHIRKKEEILQKICRDQATRFTNAMEEVEKMKNTPSGKVRILLSLHIRTALEDPTSITVFSDEWKHLETDYLHEFLEQRRDYEQRFRQIIQAGISSGEFRPLDPHIILFTLLTGIRWLHHKQRMQTSLSREILENQVVEMLMGGLENK